MTCVSAGQRPSRVVWQVQDSNLRRHTPTDLQSAPIGRSGNLPCSDPELGPAAARRKDSAAPLAVKMPSPTRRHAEDAWPTRRSTSSARSTARRSTTRCPRPPREIASATTSRAPAPRSSGPARQAIEITANAEDRANAVLDVFKEKLIKRQQSLKILDAGEPRQSGQREQDRDRAQGGHHLRGRQEDRQADPRRGPQGRQGAGPGRRAAGLVARSATTCRPCRRWSSSRTTTSRCSSPTTAEPVWSGTRRPFPRAPRVATIEGAAPPKSGATGVIPWDPRTRSRPRRLQPNRRQRTATGAPHERQRDRTAARPSRG